MSTQYPNKKKTAFPAILMGFFLAVVVAIMMITVMVGPLRPDGLAPTDARAAVRPLLKLAFSSQDWLQMSQYWPDAIRAAAVWRAHLVADAVIAIVILSTICGFIRPAWVDIHPLEKEKGTRFFPPPAGAAAARRLMAADRKRHGPGILLAPGVPLPKEGEVKGILFAGRMGSGKTVAIRYLCDQIRVLPNARAIVLDFKGDWTSDWPDDDFILLAPHDGRIRPESTQPYAMGWDISKDMSNEAACWDLAASLIPLGKEEMWGKGSRAVLVGILVGLNKQYYSKDLRRSTWTWGDLRDTMTDLTTDSQRMIDYLEKYYPQAQAFIASDEKLQGFNKTSMSYISTLISAVLSLVQPLADAWGEAPLHRLVSLRDWILAPTADDPRTIILQFAGEYPDLSMAWISSVIRTFNTLGQSAKLKNDKSRRVFFVLDELPSIAREDDKINSLLAVSRSKGFGLIAGIQGFEQLDEAWGEKIADFVLGSVAAKLVGTLGNVGKETAGAGRAAAMVGKAWFKRPTRSRSKDSTTTGHDHYQDYVAPPEFFETIGPTARGVEMGMIEGGKLMLMHWPYDTWTNRRPGVVPTLAFDSWLMDLDPERWAEMLEDMAKGRDEEHEAVAAGRQAWQRRRVMTRVGWAAFGGVLCLAVAMMAYHGRPVGPGEPAIATVDAPMFNADTGAPINCVVPRGTTVDVVEKAGDTGVVVDAPPICWRNYSRVRVTVEIKNLRQPFPWEARK